MSGDDKQLEEDWKFLLKNLETSRHDEIFKDAIRLFADNES